MKLQKRYNSEAYLLNPESKASIKLVVGLWHKLSRDNTHKTLKQLRRIVPCLAIATPKAYIQPLVNYLGLLRRDIRNYRVAQARQKGMVVSSRKLSAKFRIKPFDVEKS